MAPSSDSSMLLVGLLTAASLVFGMVVLVIRRIRERPSRRHTAIVLVLGDIGRSPRMMYHAESLARHDWETALVGYTDTPPIPSLLEIPHAHIHSITNPPRPLLKLPWVFRAPLRIVYQVWSVLKITMWTLPVRAEILLVQNPPSIPTLALAQAIAWMTGAKLIIDWHNTGYSILAMRVGEKSPLCRLAKWIEATCGKKAFAHIFVTRALREYLTNEWDLQGQRVVLHDRPPAHFRRSTPMEQHDLFKRLEPIFHPPMPKSFTGQSSDATMFTDASRKNGPALRSDRPALLVSSTSWTADEDFSPLLTALDEYQARRDAKETLPRLMVIITGKGAMRAAFERQVALREGSKWKDICVRCVFLAARDYPTMLGCADLGISVHSSSSGRDLPMKVVDMFGCGTPVLAKGFPAIGELVQDGKNGRIWNTAEELASQMIDLFEQFPANPSLRQLEDFFEVQDKSPRSPSSSLETSTEAWSSWERNWDQNFYHQILSKKA